MHGLKRAVAFFIGSGFGGSRAISRNVADSLCGCLNRFFIVFSAALRSKVVEVFGLGVTMAWRGPPVPWDPRQATDPRSLCRNFWAGLCEATGCPHMHQTFDVGHPVQTEPAQLRPAGYGLRRVGLDIAGVLDMPGKFGERLPHQEDGLCALVRHIGLEDVYVISVAKTHNMPFRSLFFHTLISHTRSI